MIEIESKQVKGLVIEFQTKPVVSIGGIISYNIVESNVSSLNFFSNKTFSYSINGGVSYSEILQLTSITSLTFSPKDRVIFKLYFLKNSISNIDIQSIQLIPQQLTNPYLEEVFSKFTFKEFFNTTDNQITHWYTNVTKKIWEKGLLPEYIDRDENTFLDFWNSITKFFALYTILGRKYGEFYKVDFLIDEYLTQRNLTTSNTQPLEELELLMSTFYKQIINRGTVAIYTKKDRFNGIDGELLRLVNYLEYDEFVFHKFSKESFGWCLGQSSPLYRGLKSNTITYDTSKYLINRSLDYNVSIDKQHTNTTTPYTISIIQYSGTGSVISSTKVIDGIKPQRSDIVLNYSIILYNSKTTNIIGRNSNISNIGKDLVLSEDCLFVEIEEKVGTVTTKLTNFSIQPLMTEYSRGFLDTLNWIHIWFTNRNRKLSILEIKQFIKHYLVPYNTHIELTDLPEGVILNLDENLLLLEDRNLLLQQTGGGIELINE